MLVQVLHVLQMRRSPAGSPVRTQQDSQTQTYNCTSKPKNIHIHARCVGQAIDRLSSVRIHTCVSCSHTHSWHLHNELLYFHLTQQCMSSYGYLSMTPMVRNYDILLCSPLIILTCTMTATQYHMRTWIPDRCWICGASRPRAFHVFHVLYIGSPAGCCQPGMSQDVTSGAGAATCARHHARASMETHTCA